tara:strand:- start:1221 stop:1427 length:207 start_codon:yes stop_codon:yes gene_type:complete
MNNLEIDVNTMTDKLFFMEDQIEHLKTQIKQLKEFGEMQVALNNKQALWVKELLLENQKMCEILNNMN